MPKQKITIKPNIHNAVFTPYLEAPQRTQIFYGGASSGKSVFIAQRCVLDLLRGGRNYLVCRAVGRTIRRSVFNEITKIISEWGLNSLFTVNKSEMIITCANGYQIMFAGLDDVEKLKSMTPQTGVVTDVWVEEATETNRDSVKQLYKRQRGESKGPKRMTLSFNPIMRTHWLYGEYFGGWDDSKQVMERDDLLIMKSTYRDNAFLTPEDRADLENEHDPYFRAVYTEGQWGVLGDVIFTNWRTEDLSERRAHTDKFYNGLDFGFSSDPAALAVMGYNPDKKELYLFDEIYERGITNDILADLIKQMIGSDYVYCDSAEPKSIEELKQHGVHAVPAEKSRDSVWYGIQWLMQHTLIVDPRCVHIIQELQQYQWQKDKDGNSMKVPVDRNNHGIDAIRYGNGVNMRPIKQAGAVW
jgi:phage terminase large subunit